MKTKRKKKRKLTKQEMRVAIARDVIEQIKLGGIVPQSGTYYHGPFLEQDTESQSKLIGIDPNNPCLVCAIGAGFVSGVRRFNHYNKGQPGSERAREFLAKFFGKRMVTYIECIFEGWTPANKRYNYHKSFNILPDIDRMIWIWKFIIRRKGEDFTYQDILLAANKFVARQQKKLGSKQAI